jgi:putative peptidoglycan lipid II flippase
MKNLVSLSLLSDRRLLISSATVAAGFFASKVLGLLREILIAHAFGTHGDLDAFFAAAQFSDLLYSVIAGGALASVFIPVFSGYLVRGEEERRAGWEFASGVINVVFLVVTLFAGLGMIFATPIVDNWLAPGFEPARRALTADLLRLVMLSTIIFGVSGTLTGILHAHNHFVLPAIAPSLYNLGIIAGTLWLAPIYGIFGLAYGVVAGSLLHLAIQLPGLIRHGARYFFTLALRTHGMTSMVGLIGPRVVTMIVVRATAIVMTNLASRLGEGSVSALSYAYSIWQFPESLIGTAISLAVFPRLSAAIAKNEIGQARALYRTALVSILGLAIPAAGGVILFARPIVALILQRGAFNSASTDLVAGVLQIYALAVIGESLLELTARIFYAQRNVRTPMFVALGSMAVRIVLMIWWSTALGAPGLALAYAVGVTLEGGILFWLARKPMSLTSTN